MNCGHEVYRINGATYHRSYEDVFAYFTIPCHHEGCLCVNPKAESDERQFSDFSNDNIKESYDVKIENEETRGGLDYMRDREIESD